MKSYSSRELIKILMQDGWYEYGNATGSHHDFKHYIKKRKVIVAHPKNDLQTRNCK